MTLTRKSAPSSHFVTFRPQKGIYHIDCTTAGPDAILFLTHQKEMYPLIPLSLKTPPHLFCLHAVRYENGPKGLVQKIKCFTTWMSCKKHRLWLQKNGYGFRNQMGHFWQWVVDRIYSIGNLASKMFSQVSKHVAIHFWCWCCEIMLTRHRGHQVIDRQAGTNCGASSQQVRPRIISS